MVKFERRVESEKPLIKAAYFESDKIDLRRVAVSPPRPLNSYAKSIFKLPALDSTAAASDCTSDLPNTNNPNPF